MTTSTASPASAVPLSALPTLDSTALFAAGREVRIRHSGEEYRLRLTSNNKLILTK
ncbi:MAG: hemin uptake protein HemP [Moraxellaceae bacterium]|nr:hemin uptake protein HemP [Moraxellaceae bacterium]